MTATITPSGPRLTGSAAPSAAGPRHGGIDDLAAPPEIALPPLLQTLRVSVRQAEFMFGARRRHGEVFRSRAQIVKGGPLVTSHPDHVKSLFTAKPEEAPSLTGESPLRPIVGPNSALTALGANHMRQRKLLLPPFHGEAIARYTDMITEAAEREIDGWPVGKPLRLAPRMQAITLDVIMAGIFGIEGELSRTSAEYRLRQVIRHLTWASTQPGSQLVELMNTGREEAVGATRMAIELLDRVTYPVIAARRRVDDLDERTDILSLLLKATYEDGRPLTDQELRDQVLTLVLAGHETTANSLAWTFERLVRNPAAYDALRHAVRTDTDAAAWVEATLTESMRNRPVIPAVGRRVAVPWQFGEYGVDAGTPVVMSIMLLHHREDLYPDPYAFRPERFLGHKPGTYDWIPFGGGIRRCLGASMAMAELRVVLEAVARRTDLEAVDPEPERLLHRNVTMIPSRDATVVVRSRS
jgi:cytochrome P450